MTLKPYVGLKIALSIPGALKSPRKLGFLQITTLLEGLGQEFLWRQRRNDVLPSPSSHKDMLGYTANTHLFFIQNIISEISDLSSDDYDYETDAEGVAIAMMPEYTLEDEQ